MGPIPNFKLAAHEVWKSNLCPFYINKWENTRNNLIYLGFDADFNVGNQPPCMYVN